ncbi:MAG: lytic murein transglycosylase B [Betaproteobacteria bacterium]|nr:lytic murein transglycosylase B [Betaproteobacteria bacterium]
MVLAAGLSLAGLSPASGQDTYAERTNVQAFMDEMAQRHGFAREQLQDWFSRASFQPAVIKAILPPASPKQRSWRIYRSRYLDPVRIAGGLRFWSENEASLAAAERRWGVPAAITVAIIGVETVYGRITGDFETFSALATLAFDYPPRADLFRNELEELLLLARERAVSPFSFSGSYAGALGIPQFLPSTYRLYGSKLEGDGSADLFASERDAIASVANFLHKHGWRAGEPVAVPAMVHGNDHLALADGKVEPRFSPDDLRAHGVAPRAPVPELPSTLVDLVTPGRPTEYWLGFPNFYVLTRYNRSSFYAMAVHQLAEKLNAARTTSSQNISSGRASAPGAP